MANMTAKMVSAYLTADDFQHTLLGEEEDVIETGMGGLDNIDHLELYLFLMRMATMCISEQRNM